MMLAWEVRAWREGAARQEGSSVLRLIPDRDTLLLLLQGHVEEKGDVHRVQGPTCASQGPESHS